MMCQQESNPCLGIWICFRLFEEGARRLKVAAPQEGLKMEMWGEVGTSPSENKGKILPLAGNKKKITTLIHG